MKRQVKETRSVWVAIWLFLYQIMSVRGVEGLTVQSNGFTTSNEGSSELVCVVRSDLDASVIIIDLYLHRHRLGGILSNQRLDDLCQQVTWNGGLNLKTRGTNFGDLHNEMINLMILIERVQNAQRRGATFLWSH